ncbi:class IV lanthionine synthetase LanL [Kitasatospora cinereorecta]|uniref:Class IV lanthionine synthetase LanL n=1 Tax=Kitasatospora cinereorecta TaxID=285560 RepID=A0ABW0VQP3_9ACTN
MDQSIAGIGGRSDDTWSYLSDPRMPAMEHGWKLHVSTRPGELDAVLDLVLPVLRRHVCHAKYARDAETLRQINSGTASAGVVGKAITVYPAAGTVAALAAELVTVLRGREGPQVVSDRRVDPGAPVYYRYGPFTGDYRTGRSGRLESVMTGPDGQLFDGLAGNTYRCPPWAEDPFTDRSERVVPAPTPPPSGTSFGGGRYQVTRGIARKPQGNLYRAVDRTTGHPVVVKQARAYVAEDESGTDTRDRLRNERAVLTALDAVDGVPRALDYFRHRADEYLVLTDCGDRNLRRDVQDHGPHRDRSEHPEQPGRMPAALAARLLHVLDRIHERGVVVRDLKPDNVVLDAAGRCHVIDFGISTLDGTGPGGATPGYSAPPRYATGGFADDYYSLGATLHFAATGLDPVIVDADPAVNLGRTLDSLTHALPGDRHRQLRATIAGLLNPDPAVRTATAERLRTGRPAPAPARPRAPERLDDDRLAEIIEHTVAYCADEARRIADPELSARAAIPTPVDLYGGSSGLGLELLHHTDRPRVRETVDALADWTARRTGPLSPGLWSGRTGVDLFLAEAGTLTPAGQHDRPDLPDRGPNGGPPEADLIEGIAGIGTGHLLLSHHARTTGDHPAADRHLAVAAACHRLLTTGRARLTPAGPDTRGSAALRDGLAHGHAGIASFLLEYAHSSGDPAAADAAREACDRLAAATPRIIAAAKQPDATRRYGSWCRGLAGIGSVHLRAADRLGEPAHLDLARQAAQTCLGLAPRMPLVTQCCGLAGVGDFLLDAARATDSDELLTGARTTALIILARSGGTPTRPTFPDTGLTRPSTPWATGTSGVLTFLRRLHHPTTPRPAHLP